MPEKLSRRGDPSPPWRSRAALERLTLAWRSRAGLENPALSWRSRAMAKSGDLRRNARHLFVPAPLCYRAVMAKQLTIRGVPDEVGQRLERLSQARGQSVNTTVLHILEAAVGVDERRKRLARYATWTPEDQAEFNEALALQRTIDDPLWR